MPHKALSTHTHTSDVCRYVLLFSFDSTLISPLRALLSQRAVGEEEEVLAQRYQNPIAATAAAAPNLPNSNNLSVFYILKRHQTPFSGPPFLFEIAARRVSSGASINDDNISAMRESVAFCPAPPPVRPLAHIIHLVVRVSFIGAARYSPAERARERYLSQINYLYRS